MSIIVRASLGFIKFYQKWFSPWLGTQCRFRPTCSHYAAEAISKYGFLRGWAMGVFRILRCNPFATGGDDPVI